MHCHIVFNSVGRYDGAKYRYVNGDWEKNIQPVTDEITENMVYHGWNMIRVINVLVVPMQNILQ